MVKDTKNWDNKLSESYNYLVEETTIEHQLPNEEERTIQKDSGPYVFNFFWIRKGQYHNINEIRK